MALINWQESRPNPALKEVAYSYNYEKHMENMVLRNAISSGYFNSLTVKQLLAQCRKKNRQLESSDSNISDFEAHFHGNIDTLDSIELLNLSSTKLRAITAIGACVNLTVCDLSGNYLEKINALESCKFLRKLDLHQNRIMELPYAEFWKGLINLQALYMHDNGISSFAEVKKLSTAPSLLILTMYDTPVSLKMYYRHFIANSIWTLKALDHIVISDEEIVEDASFTDRFQAKQPQFIFKPQSLEREESWTVEDEIHALHMDIAVINKIQAKFCPVLVIQRFARGFLTRLRYQYEQEKRFWAAVIIQRSYRTYRGFEVPQEPPIADHWSRAGMLPKPVDYDTYMRYRQADRTFRSKHAAPSYFTETSCTMQTEQSFEKASSGGMKLYIDLVELEASTSKYVDDPSSLEASHSRKRRGKKFHSSHGSSQPLYPGKESQVFDVTSVGKFGRLPKLQKKRKNQSMKMPTVGDTRTMKQEDEVIDDSEEGFIVFRLAGLPAPRVESDILEGLTRSIVDGARDIRETVRDFEMRRARTPKPIVQRSCPMTIDQKMFIRTHGTISLSCFRAVDQAYKDRDRAKSLSAKMQQNLLQKRRREMMAQIRDNKKYELIEKLQEIKNETKNELTQAMELQKSELLAKKDSVALKKNERERRISVRKQAVAFAAEFSNQANAIYKAISSHAATTAKGRIIEAKREKAKCLKEDMDRQREIIRRYNEHRKLLLQSETALDKSQLETELHERSQIYREEARLRVRKLRQENLHKGVTVPCISSVPSKLPPLAVVADAQMTTWEDMPKNKLEVREHDRVNFWLS